MPTYTYTKLADFILDQLWGYASANAMKNSIRYLGEDILGDPSANSDKVNFSSATTTAGNAARNNTTKTISSTAGIGGLAQAVLSSFSTSSTTYTNVTGASITLTTNGRPVRIWLSSNTAIGFSAVGIFKNGVGSLGRLQLDIKILKGGVTNVGQFMSLHDYVADTSTSHAHYVPCSSISAIDTTVNGIPGTYTYTLQVQVNDAGVTGAINGCTFNAEEII